MLGWAKTCVAPLSPQQRPWGPGLFPPTMLVPQVRPPASRFLPPVHTGMRGFMTDHGQPDQPRSARLVLKDFVTVRFGAPEPGCQPWGRAAFKSGGRGGCILLSQGLAVLLHWGAGCLHHR